ncbi:unnamed protein product [Arctia plantaginis]|uniref:Uncharacterized protein n=1 Tax=Arctia plantaginis TaxID=874455 RepID=A0A8S1A146_ARCPL|nr:unnamed protein product [Arctia plantaginis]
MEIVSDNPSKVSRHWRRRTDVMVTRACVTETRGALGRSTCRGGPSATNIRAPNIGPAEHSSDNCEI